VRSSKKRKLPETEPARAKGGHLVHAKIKGEWSALCGYTPSAPNHFRMKDRSGWTHVLAAMKGGDPEITCTRCLEKFRKAYEQK